MPALPASHLDRPVCTLVAERDTHTRDMYATFLRQCGCDVEEAQDGPEALAKAFSCHPHVIVTGTRLAGMSGIDLCRVLRMDHLTSSIRIVVVASDAATDGRRALSAGADSVLPKPCSPEALFREITQLVKTQVLDDEARQARSGSDRARLEADPLADGIELARKRVMLNHVHERHVTLEPTTPPPALVCPVCYEPLKYTKSYIGGVSARHPEQWDYFDCRSGCGAFQYRHRTRKLRQI